MKMSLRPHFMTVIICIAFVVMALVMPMFTSQAFANNSADSPYNSWINYGSVSFTDAREKTDFTSSWDDYDYGPAHKVEVFATGWDWNPTYVGSPAIYKSTPWAGYLTNYVKESGYPRALLWFSDPSYSGNIGGYWSPDSV